MSCGCGSKKQPIGFKGVFWGILTLSGRCATLNGCIKELIHVTQEVVSRFYELSVVWAIGPRVSHWATHWTLCSVYEHMDVTFLPVWMNTVQYRQRGLPWIQSVCSLSLKTNIIVNNESGLLLCFLTHTVNDWVNHNHTNCSVKFLNMKFLIIN